MSLGRVAPVVFGSVLLAMAFSSLGCNVRREWPTRQFAREHKPTDEGPVTFAPDVTQAGYNRMALDGLPSMVQVMFRRDHPEAAVTAVEQVPTGTGVMLYRVAYLEDGTAGSSMYRAGGRDMSAPTPSIIRHDDSGRPPAKYAPSTQPTQQTGIGVLAPNQHQ